MLRAKVCNAKTRGARREGRKEGRKGGNASAKAGGVIRHKTEFHSGVKEEQRNPSTQTSLNYRGEFGSEGFRAVLRVLYSLSLVPWVWQAVSNNVESDAHLENIMVSYKINNSLVKC